jgi:ribosomal protein S18 acetylase RimI-like enzyme
MSTADVTVRPTIDRAWLERAAAADPFPHAYALWDLDQYPDRVRFVSALRGDRTTGYLLIWPGRDAVVVHWFGAKEEAPLLAEQLPPRPLILVVSDEVRAEVERLRGPVVSYPVLLLVAPPGAGSPIPPTGGHSRRLTGDDRAALRALTDGPKEMVAMGYSAVDPGQEVVWGVFEEGELCGAARASVTLPSVWVLSGVFVHPSKRGRGLGHTLVRAVLDDARRAGVPVGLYVREDQRAARAVYDRAGFRLRDRRTWMDAGAGLEP